MNEEFFKKFFIYFILHLYKKKEIIYNTISLFIKFIYYTCKKFIKISNLKTSVQPSNNKS